VSAGRTGARRLWLYSNGIDVFVRDAEIIDLWPASPVWAA
jgi:hypothetical protein